MLLVYNAKQADCFDHRVVTQVAEKLERLWLLIRGLLWY